MTDIKLSLACVATDRTRPVLDGRAPIRGVKIAATTGEPEEIFRQVLREKSFEIAELSMGSHIVTTARGDSSYVGIPVFLSRAFRHSNIFVRTDRGIKRMEDLKGRRVGLPEYQQTAALWIRGILKDQHGVGPEDVTWVVGSQEQPGGTERIALDLPPSIKIERLGPNDTLNALLVSGDIEAIVTPRLPSSYLNKTAPVDRLFPNFQEAEIAFHKRTGFFPIMHCLTVRKDVADAHPWLPLELFHAFAKAKEMAMVELGFINVLRVALPWVAASLAETRAAMGTNYWKYGFAANRDELAAITRYAFADGLANRLVSPEELFHPSTLEAAEAPG